jgi:hypothetical protein
MFSIPNEVDAGFTSQAEPDSRDFDILAAGVSGHGVIQGCAVAAQGAPDMTVAVAVGTVQLRGRLVRKVAAGNVAITAAHATLNRIDLVTVDPSGTKGAIAGTAAALPVLPPITAGHVVLAAVYVPATDTAINANQIIDKRCVLQPNAVMAPGSTTIYSEFINGLDSNWTASGSGTTGAQAVAGVGTKNQWGTLVISTGTVAGGREAILATANNIGFGAGESYMGVSVNLPVLSTGSERYNVWAGANDGVTGSAADGIYFAYSDSVNGAKWQCCTRSNAAATSTDSGVAVVAATQYLLEWEVNGDGTSVTFYINGASVATITTNIPTAAGRETTLQIGINKTVGSGNSDIVVDKFDVVYLPLNPY